MKHVIAALAVVLSVTGASAADMYRGGGMKDGQYTPDTRESSSNHSGWSAYAFIGYAMGERDVKSEANAFLNCTNAYDLTGLSEEDRAEIEEGVAELNELGVFATHTTDGTLGKIVIPVLGALFGTSDNDDFNSFVFGGGVEYLWHRGQFGLALNVGVTAYADADSSTTFTGVPTQFANGTLANAFTQHAGEDTGLTVSGFTSVERQLDIDLTLKPYYFFTPDTAIFAKVGPSFAKAKISGGVSVDGVDGASMEYESDEWSIGYVLGLGMTTWWNPNWSSTLEGDFKDHSFSASGKKSVDLGKNCFCNDGMSVDASGKTEANDNVWTVKLGSSYHF